VRDTSRIAPTLAMIDILWRRYPDMRLGQLLMNIEHDNLWNLEEDDLQMRIANVLADGFGKSPVIAHTEGAT
jgi:hypothetical protein